MDLLDPTQVTRGRPAGHRFRGRALTGASLALAAILGCSAESPEDGPYSARFAEAMQQATSDFEREVLADGVVTRAEYEEAVERYVECMADVGIKVTLIDQEGYYVYSFAQTPGLDAADIECMRGTTLLVSGLYTDPLKNPGNDDYDEIVVACLKRAGVVDERYTATQFASDSVDHTLPVDDEDPALSRCMANPSSDLPAPP